MIKKNTYTPKKFKTNNKISISTEKQCIESLNLMKNVVWNHILIWTKAKNDFEKDFFKWLSNAFFGKPMENVRKHRDIKLAAAEERRNYLVSETTYHATKIFFWKSISNRKEKNTHVSE